mgnify:FL=1
MIMNTFVLAALALVPQPTKVKDLDSTIPLESPIAVAVETDIPSEGYRLDVNPTGAVTIACSDAAGEFYARQTLKQLAGPNGYACALISDRPAYRWRGLQVDESRHFFGKDVLKKTMDIMAQHKLNVLHWHLTDDQGWRIEVPGYPELLKYGAVRSASPKHGARLRQTAEGVDEMEMDGQTYGPFYYTEADIREIVSYAAARQIKIVPEIELPGHVFAALAAYPEFACYPENLSKRSPRLVWGIEKDVLCLGNDRAIKFMEDVLDYVCRVFPSDVVHIGGDECPQIRWKTCPKCQKRIADEKLGSEKGLQPWITRHFVQFLAARGKRAIGWDEYLLGEGIPTTAISMSWRVGRQGTGHECLTPAELAARGHDVVMTPTKFCYLDYGQALKDDPFQYIGGSLPLAKCHSLDPRADVPENLRSHILGGQGNNWSEYTWNQYDLEWKMWPRACALAEVFWLGDKKPSFEDFLRRMKVHRSRLIHQGINCAPLE